MTKETWDVAQREELAVWERTAVSAVSMFGELGEVGELVEFGRRNGVGDVDAVIELGIGPLGMGYGAVTGIARSVGIDPLPRLDVTTGDPDIDALAKTLQSRTEYLQTDAGKRLPFDDASFPLVVCDNVIDHTDVPQDILIEARRLIEPGGWFVFGVNVFSVVGLQKWRQYTRRRYPNDANILCHPHSFTTPKALALLRASGFSPVAVADASPLRRTIGSAYRLRVVATPA